MNINLFPVGFLLYFLIYLQIYLIALDLKGRNLDSLWMCPKCLAQWLIYKRLLVSTLIHERNFIQPSSTDKTTLFDIIWAEFVEREQICYLKKLF